MKKLFLGCLLIFEVIHVRADVLHDVLKKYLTESCIVTGIGRGVNFESALFAGFKHIYGMDEESILVEHAHKLLPHMLAFTQSNPKEVKIVQGEPKTSLHEIINTINGQATFLLSSYIHDPDACDKSLGIMFELDQIKNHPIKTHTILVDYFSQNTSSFGSLSLELVKQKILEINPSYLFRFEVGGHLGREDQGILVAYIA